MSSRCPFICLFVRLLPFILKTNELIMPVGISGPWGKVVKRSTLRSKIKLTQGQR